MGNNLTDACNDSQHVGTRFFQTNAIPPTLWNACNYVLQFNFHKMHVAGTQNIATDFLSRNELNPKKRVELKIR